jgi:hypothetical protein
MGYTHYYVRDKREVGSPVQFGELALNTKKIIAEAQAQGIDICGGLGEGKPEFTEAYFMLNGNLKGDLWHETFAWFGNPEQSKWQAERYKDTDQENDIFSYCKTNHKPYDAVVTAVLIRAKVIYGQLVDVYSDGSWEDWQTGRDLYEKVFGEVAPCPFVEELV